MASGSRVRASVDQLHRMGVRQGAASTTTASRPQTHPREGALERVGAAHVDGFSVMPRARSGLRAPGCEQHCDVHRIEDHPHPGDPAGGDLSQGFQPFRASSRSGGPPVRFPPGRADLRRAGADRVATPTNTMGIVWSHPWRPMRRHAPAKIRSTGSRTSSAARAGAPRPARGTIGNSTARFWPST